MNTYKLMLSQVKRFGIPRQSRAGDTTGFFGYRFEHSMHEGFPLLTTKRMSFHNIVTELLWFLRGETNIRWLQERKCTIWDEFADENGNLGPVYGAQWRNFGGGSTGVDQIKDLITGLIKDPFSRRHIVTAWDPTKIKYMALPPCHMFFQCSVSRFYGREFLDLQMYQRSADLFLGVPYNIASYALLLLILAQMCDYVPGCLMITFGDLHIYTNHLPQVDEQLAREPKPLPRVKLPKINSIDDFKSLEPQDFTLQGYDYHPAIKADVNVGALGGRT